MNMQDSYLSTVEAAMEAAARGWHVFPVPQGTKKSHKSGKYSGGRPWGATTDPDEIRRDWAHWPEANLGVVTGARSGFFVIDCDTTDAHRADGVGTLQSWIEEHGELPHTIEAKTPSGGLHFYFRLIPGLEIRNSDSALAPGIDIRGEGGMVVLPPSVRPGGGAYTWRNPPGFFDLGACPAWLLDKIRTAQAPKLSEHAMPRLDATPAELDEVAELLDYIDPDAGGYDQWVNVLMALHDHTGGGAGGLALADHWSAGGAKYKPGEVAAKWRSFTPGGGVGLGTVAALARQGGAGLSEIARRHKGRTGGENTGFGASLATAAAPTSDGRPRPNAPDEIDLSHDALASHMGARGWDRDARHVATWGQWLFWSGSHWRLDGTLDHLTRTRVYLRTRAEELVQWAEGRAAMKDAEKEGDGDKLRRWAKEQARHLRSANTVAAVEKLARSNPASVAAPDAFDDDPMLLGTPGGVVDLRTGVLREARREDMLTKLTQCAPAAQGSRPERWLTFLHDIFDGDRDLMDFMQRAAGYALTGETREHKLLFLYGTGRNGKSVFLNMLMHLWQDYARSVPAATFLHSQTERHPTDVAGLQGARLAVASELPKGKTWDEGTIKDLTGGDRLTARRMRQDFFEFDPQLTLMIAGNIMPSFQGVDEAIRARVVLVPFTVTIPPERRDTTLPEKLKAEGPGILRWALEGALEWQRRGLDVPASVAAASAEYFDDEDMLGQFLADETRSDPAGFTTTTDLHYRFSQWCERQGLHPWTLRTLQKEIKARGLHDTRRRHGRGFSGVRLA